MKLPNSVLSIFMLLESLSEESYIVGGAVRDFIKGIDAHDIDIVTETDINVVAELFSENGWECNTTGMNFLVLNVSKEFPVEVQDKFGSHYELRSEHFEIAQFRKDVKHNGRHCDVMPATINEDAQRRDFTVNALYYNPMRGEFVDPTGLAKYDIENSVLQFIGKPEDRIREDYLRVWRFFRFIKKGFVPTKKSAKAIKTMFKEAYKNSNDMRVMTEMLKYHDMP